MGMEKPGVASSGVMGDAGGLERRDVEGCGQASCVAVGAGGDVKEGVISERNVYVREGFGLSTSGGMSMQRVRRVKRNERAVLTVLVDIVSNDRVVFAI